MNPQKVLIWLPSPLGDAVMATPALRAFRTLYADADITFIAGGFTRQILSGCPFGDRWIEPEKSLPAMVKKLRGESFDTAVLLKNSFGSALAIRLAGIGRRIGYARDGRGLLLTDRIAPTREHGRFKPAPMVDYYLKIAEHLGAKNASRQPELTVEPNDRTALLEALPFLNELNGPLAVLVPGGAFGPSKMWPVERFAQLADALQQRYNAASVISIAPIQKEIDIAEAICRQAASGPVHLGKTPLSGGALKALIERADLVITNDTGPRHIAIGLNRAVISLFGPNNPEWTQTGHTKEVQIVGRAACVPCDKPVCRAERHLCMESITVEQVLEAAGQFLAK